MINMSAGVFGYGNNLTKTIRVTPTEFAQLQSNPKQVVTGIPGFACLLLSACAIPYTGTTPYNESERILISSTLGNNQGKSTNITNLGDSCIIPIQDGTATLGNGNGLIIEMNSDLTGGDIGYDITIIYTYVNI